MGSEVYNLSFFIWYMTFLHMKFLVCINNTFKITAQTLLQGGISRVKRAISLQISQIPALPSQWTQHVSALRG